MTLFAESGGMLGVACERCGRQITGEYPRYGELLAAAAGWTLRSCPGCRPEQRSWRETPRRTGVPPQSLPGYVVSPPDSG